MVNPGAVTLCSFALVVVLRAFSEACSEKSKTVDMQS